MSLHNSLQSTLESVERKNRALLKKRTKPGDPKRGDGCTLITAWTRRPGTVISVDERRMFIQEDRVEFVDGNQIFEGNQKGTLHGFRRVKNSQKWNYASDWRIRGQTTLGVIFGRREWDEPEIPWEPEDET